LSYGRIKQTDYRNSQALIGKADMRESTRCSLGAGVALLMLLLGVVGWWPYLHDPYAWPIMFFGGCIFLGGAAWLTTAGSMAAREEVDHDGFVHAQHERAGRIRKRQGELREALEARFPGTTASPIGDYDWRILDVGTGQVINEYSGREALAVLGLL
jgi:hypothetical protein